jgi:hypothetical protein
VRGFIDRVDDGVAVLLLDGGGRAYVPEAALPSGVGAGQLVEVTVTPLGPMPAEEMAALIERLRSGGHRHG